MLDGKQIIVIPDSGLFELGVSVGFGAIAGGFLAVCLWKAFDLIIDAITSLFRKSS